MHSMCFDLYLRFGTVSDMKKALKPIICGSYNGHIYSLTKTFESNIVDMSTENSIWSLEKLFSIYFSKCSIKR